MFYYSGVEAKATSESHETNARVYKSGSLEAQNYDQQTNSAYAGIIAETDLEGYDFDAYGNHKFKEEG